MSDILTEGEVRLLMAEPVINRWAERLLARLIARMYSVPPWLIGIGKRPPIPKVSGQRGTGHHRPHRRA